jgi:hypothetical protein
MVNGWIQDRQQAADSYRPDFRNRDHPFAAECGSGSGGA